MKKHFTKKIIIMALAVLLVSVCACIAIFATDSTQTYGETLDSVSASVGGKVSLNFNYTSLGSAAAFAADVYSADGATCVRSAEIHAVSESNKTVSVSLTPSEMANIVKVYPVTVENGEITARGEGKSYSVKQYALDVIASNDEKHTPHHNTMRALLNWGAMAEKTVSDVALPLANDGLYTRGTNPISGVTESFATDKGSIVENTGSYGCVLTFDINENIFNFYFTGLTDGTYTATVYKGVGESKKEVGTATAVKDTVTVEGETKDAYKISISNVGVAVYDETYTVELKNADNASVIKASGNVLYYLSELAFATDTNAKYNDIAKSMYQLYTLAMDKITPATCKHAESHLRNAGDTSYLVECSVCFSELSSAIDNKIDMYSLGNNIAVNETYASMDVEHVAANGTNHAYTRFDNLQIKEDTHKNTWPWARINIVNSATGIENGRYLVFRYRLKTTAVTSQTTQLKIYVSSTDMPGKAIPTTDSWSVNVVNNKDTNWRTIVVDLWQNAEGKENYTGGLNYNATTETATIKLLQFEFVSHYKVDSATNLVSSNWSDGDYFDVAYASVVDDFAEVREVMAAEGAWDSIKFSYKTTPAGATFYKYSFGEIAPVTTPASTDFCNNSHTLTPTTINGQDALACTCGYAEKTCVHSYVKYSITGLVCSKCGETSENAEPHESLKILAIGNSFSEDATAYLWSILKEAGINDVTVANMYIGGATVGKHNTNFANDTAAYTYQEYTSATMSTTAEQKLSDILAKGWDIVILQQASAYTGRTEDYSGVPTLVENVKKALPDCQLYWHMTWAYQNDYVNDDFASFYGSNQMTMYNGICTAVQANIVPDNSFVGIIPSGTAIQNLRTSYLGDTLTRDGYHMSYDIGRYAVALTWAAELGVNIDNITYAPNGNDVTDATPAIKEAVKNAAADNFKVTESTHKMAPWVEKYNSADVIIDSSSFYGSTGVTMDKEYIDEGDGYVRVDNLAFSDCTTSSWPSIRYNLIADTNGIKGVRYLVFKYRIGADNKLINENSKKATYMSCFASSTYQSVTDTLNVDVTIDGEWHTVVLDLCRVNVNCPKGEDGTATLKYFQIQPLLANTNGTTAQWVADSNDSTKAISAWSTESYIDIEYVAVVDQYSDLKSIIDQDTYTYRVSTADTKNYEFNTSDIGDTAPTSAPTSAPAN